MTVEVTDRAEDLAWLATRAGIAVTPALRAIKSVDDSGRIHGMVGFDGWTPGSCSLHVAVEHPAALRRLIGPAFRIAFLELQKQVVIGAVLSTNKRSLNLVRHLGFVEAGRIRNGWDKGVALVLFEMQRDACRFIAPPQEEHDGSRWRQGGRSSAAGVQRVGAGGDQLGR